MPKMSASSKGIYQFKEEGAMFDIIKTAIMLCYGTMLLIVGFKDDNQVYQVIGHIWVVGSILVF